MRLIDADLLTNTIDNACYASHNVASLSSVCGAICDIIDHEKTYNPWIKCSDRMPEMEDSDYIGDVHIWVDGGMASVKCGWDCIRHYEHAHGVKVTHWMTPEKGPDYYENEK